MGWSNQFSLSVEVTRVLGPAAIDRAGNAVIHLARNLQSSGSDIVIEQELGALFSRFLIPDAFVQEFKERTLSVNSVKKISDFVPLALQAGPGPTVQRALKDPAFIPMVVHLSMFGATHDYGSVAEALSGAMANESEDNSTVDKPFYQPRMIRGAIQACVEQTTGFQWHLLVHTIMTKIQLPAYDVAPEYEGRVSAKDRGLYFRLSQTQFEALLDLLLAVSRVYREHTIVCEGRQGIIPIILWAHYVLGLSVLAKDSPAGDVVFGDGHEALVIQYKKNLPVGNIYLMAPSQLNDIELQVPNREETVDLIAQRLLPACGYAKALLCGVQEGQDRYKTLTVAAQRELSHYAAALALMLGDNLFDIDIKKPESLRETMLRQAPSLFNEKPRLVFDAARFILQDFFDMEAIKKAFKLLLVNSSPHQAPVPSSLAHLESTEPDWKAVWDRHWGITEALAQIILAFAAVGDLTQCQDLVIGDILLREQEFNRLYDVAERMAQNNYWFVLLNSLLNCKLQYIDDDAATCCLTSHHAWSVYKETMQSRDPADCKHSRIWIQRGVPIYNGVTARRIKDGPTNIPSQARVLQVAEPPVFRLGKRHYISLDNYAQAMKPFISTSTEEWKFNRRLWQGPPEARLVSVGCSLLHEALTRVICVNSCKHADGSSVERATQEGCESFRLAAGMALVHGSWFKQSSGGCRVYIAETYKNSIARWLAVAGWNESRSRRLAVLRHSSVCVSCFVTQACQLEDEGHGLYLIL